MAGVVTGLITQGGSLELRKAGLGKRGGSVNTHGGSRGRP